MAPSTVTSPGPIRNGKTCRTALEALVIFAGADAYVSPGFYPSKAEHGKVVPTWNYVAVHAYGTAEVFTDAERLLNLVSASD